MDAWLHHESARAGICAMVEVGFHLPAASRHGSINCRLQLGALVRAWKCGSAEHCLLQNQRDRQNHRITSWMSACRLAAGKDRNNGTVPRKHLDAGTGGAITTVFGTAQVLKLVRAGSVIYRHHLEGVFGTAGKRGVNCPVSRLTGHPTRGPGS